MSNTPEIPALSSAADIARGFMRWPEVLEVTDIKSKKTVQNWIRAGKFPAPISDYPARRPVFNRAEVVAYVNGLLNKTA